MNYDWLNFILSVNRSAVTATLAGETNTNLDSVYASVNKIKRTGSQKKLNNYELEYEMREPQPQLSPPESNSDNTGDSYCVIL